MAMFLKILGIIGIILLSILGLILLVIFLVLFVPVRYKAEGSFKDNKPSVCARASWLLHLLSIRYTLGEKEPLIIRVCGFKIKKKEEKVPDFEDETQDESDVAESTAKEPVISESIVSEPTISEPINSETENISEVEEDSDTPEEPSNKPKKIGRAL